MDSRQLLRKRAAMAVLAAGNADNALLFVYNEWTIRQQAKVAAFRAAFRVPAGEPINIDGQLWSFVRVFDDKDKPDGSGRLNLHRVAVPDAQPTKPDKPKDKIGRKDGIVQWWLKGGPSKPGKEQK